MVFGALKPADVAWLAMLAGVVAYEVLSPRGELLSEGWDRYLERFPVSARPVPVVLTAHVINALPPRFDPVHRVFLLCAALGGSSGKN